MYFFQSNYSLGFLIGTALGLLLSTRLGLTGLIIGIYAGNKIDEAIRKAQRKNRRTNTRSLWNEQLISSTYSLSGHLAKYDGQVSASSIDAIEASLKTQRFNKEKISLAKKAFNQGKDPCFNFLMTVQSLHIALLLRPSLRNTIIQILVSVVAADMNTSAAKQQRLDPSSIVSASLERIEHISRAYANTNLRKILIGHAKCWE